MEMGRSGNGSGGKVVTFDDAVTGRRRSGSSLSSYLDMGRDAADGGRATTPRPLPLPAHTMASRRRTYADGELDVFSAERYFKGAMDGEGDRKEGFSVATPAVAVQVQQHFLVETAAAPARPAAKAVVMAKPSSTRASTVSFTASSAASSANSQTALFRGGLRRRRDNRCCVQVGVLMRTCSGKRSVRVDGCAAKEGLDVAAAVPAAATGIDWYRELRMHKASLGLAGDGNSHGLVAAGLPPSLNLGGTAKVAAIGREMIGGDEKEPAELTLSSSTRRRSNFTLVAPVRASVPATGRVGVPGGGDGKGGRGGGAHHLHDENDDDDAGSESSSDLFEIKSLMIDESPYEPSEASIQWSVVTADAASERGDRVPAPARWVGGGGAARRPPVAGSRQPRGHRPAGILAGCASHRAVDVSAATTTKAVPNAAAAVVPVATTQQRRSEGFHMARNGA